MGCMQSKGAAKDPDDKTLDEVEFKEIGVEDFDGVFETAASPINNTANVNNNLIESQENLQSAVLSLADKYYNVLVEFSDKAKVAVQEVTEKATKGLSDTEIAGISELSGAFKKATAAVTAFNDALAEAEGAEVAVKANRLVVTGAKDKAAKANLVNLAINVNRAAFAVRKAGLVAVGKGSMTFKDTLVEAFTALKDAGAKPKVAPNLDKLAEGEIDFDCSLDGSAGKAQKLWDAITGLTDNMKESVSSTVGIKGDLEAASEAVQGLPTDPSEIMNKVKDAGISGLGAMKAVKAVASNAKSFTESAKYLPTFLATVKALANDIKEASP